MAAAPPLCYADAMQTVWRLIPALLATALGCGDGGGSSLGAPVDEGAGGAEGEVPLGTSTVSGHVLNAEGESVAALSVTLCGVVCNIVKTDDDGQFAFDGVGAGVKVIEAATVPRGDDFTLAVRSWTRFFDFVSVGDDEEVTIDTPLVLHRVANAVGPLTGAQDLQLAPELTVRFDADEILDDGALPAGADSVWLGAVEIPKKDWPQAGLNGWTVVAAWGLAIWDLEAPDAFSVNATLPTPLDPDAEVAFLVADYEYGFTEGHFYEEAAELSEDGAILRTPAGAGLDRATRWLAVTRSP